MAQAYPAGKEQDYSRHEPARGNLLHLALIPGRYFSLAQEHTAL